MQVVGLTGYAGSGKSTVANYLVERHGFTRLSFAAPLKKMLRTLDPIVDTFPAYSANLRRHVATPVKLSHVFADHAGDELAVKAGPFGDEYRRLLQVLGTDCIRAVDEDFWVKAAVAQMTDPEGKYVFDDVRFPNEAETISRLSGYGLWNIEREGYAPVNGHASEQHAGNMGEFLTVSNTDLRRLYSGIDLAMEMYFGSVSV